MIVPLEERDKILKTMKYKEGLEKFLIELNPPKGFRFFFQTPYYIFNYNESEYFKDRNLLPLFEYVEQVHAFDLNNKEYIHFDLESPDSLTIHKNIYSVFLYIFILHAWEHGGEEKEAKEVIEFSSTINFPYWEQLRDIMNDEYEEGDLIKLEKQLESEPETGPN